jgi:acetoin utilization protein AcuB
MNTNVVTVKAHDSMVDANYLLKKYDIRVLPVMKKNKLVGIVTDRDLKRASASDATTLEVHELLYLLSKIKVEDIMSEELITIPFDYTVEEAAELLLENKISALPVVDNDGRMVGIITEANLYRVLIALTGVSKGGIHFAVMLEDRPGSIKEVTDVIRGYGGRLASILSSYDRVPEGYRKVYVRAYNIDRSRLEELIHTLRSQADMLYMIDHRENRREIYQGHHASQESD